MSNGYGEESPANKIATAQATFALAARLDAEVGAGRINKDIYSRAVTLVTGGPGLHLPASPESTDDDLRNGVFNILLIALSASALTLDETLDEVFGPSHADTEPSRVGIRVLVNQLRNAFAHNPWRPRWQIKERYWQQYPIELEDGSKFTFDARNLNGNPIKPEDVGGLEFWVKVMKHCENLVSK
jgi:hypothetical protein